MSGRTLVLEVDLDKYESLVEALGKRPYIRVVSMDRQGRKDLVDCPACHKRLSKESSFTINDLMVCCLTKIVDKMRSFKSVLLVNKDNPASGVSEVERERCVEVDPTTIFRAEALGLINSFTDGSKLSYFVTTAGMDFLSGEKPAAPCTLVVLDKEVVETSGELMIEDVKCKDSFKITTVVRNASKAVEALPESVLNFVTNGQMSLI